MKYLIDTHVLIWFAEGNSQLPLPIQQLISSPENDIFVSHVCFWEIAIKISIGKLKMTKSLSELGASLQENGFSALSTKLQHFEVLMSLPFHHQAPFDRLIIAQAIGEDMTIISHDAQFQSYPVRLLHF